MATEPRRSARTRKGLRKKVALEQERGRSLERPEWLSASVMKHIRMLRSKLGREMFTLYDELEPLRVKHFEMNKLWTVDELMFGAEGAERLAKVATLVKRKIDAIATEVKLARVNEKRLHEASLDLNRGLRFLQRVVPSGELREMLAEGRDAAQVYFMDNLNKGVGMLRFAWSKLFYVTSAEPYVMKLSDAETYLWYRALEDGNKPPALMIQEFESYANERGVPVEVYDVEDNWIWSQPPFQNLGERPLALSLALKEPRRARQRWHFRRVDAATGRALAEQLSADEQKLVQEFLERNQGRSFTLDEIATYAGVGIRDVAPEGGATPNPRDKTAAEDLALHRAVMLMDLERAGSTMAEAFVANTEHPGRPALTKREEQMYDRLRQQGLSRGIHPYNVRIGKTLESLIDKGYVERRGAFFYPGKADGPVPTPNAVSREQRELLETLSDKELYETYAGTSDKNIRDAAMIEMGQRLIEAGEMGVSAMTAAQLVGKYQRMFLRPQWARPVRGKSRKQTTANPRYGRSSAGPGIFADSYEEAEEEVRALVAGSVGPGTSPAEVVVKHTTAQIERQIEEMKDHLGNTWILTPEGQRLEAERRLSLRRRTRKNGSRAKRVSVSPLSKADVLAKLEEAENLAYSPRAFPPGRTLEARNIIGHLWAEADDAGNNELAALLEHLDEVSDRDLSGAIEDVVAAVS